MIQHSPAQTVRPPIIVVGVEQEWAARSLETVLAPSGFAVVRAYSGRQTLDLAEVASPDIVLIDSRLPDMDGIDVCRTLREERTVGAHVPVVITTSGAATREFLRQAYLAGAWSVWEQPIDGELLVLRLNTWVEAKRVVNEADRLSLVDVESGLYTATGMQRRAREVLADAQRRRTPVACIAIGPMVPPSGDALEESLAPTRLAAEIGRLVARVARESDVVGRVGASEFAILAPTTTQRGAMELVERLRDRLSTTPIVAGDRSSRVTLRAGVAAVSEDALGQPTDGAEILRRAATALRYAQASRASMVRSFDEVPATFV